MTNCGVEETSKDLFDYSNQCFSSYIIPALSGIDLVLSFSLGCVCLYHIINNMSQLKALIRSRQFNIRTSLVMVLLLRTFFVVPAKIIILSVKLKESQWIVWGPCAKNNNNKKKNFKLEQTGRTLADRDVYLFVFECAGMICFSSWSTVCFFGMFKIFNKLSHFTTRRHHEDYYAVKIILAIFQISFVLIWAIIYFHVFWDDYPLGIYWFIGCAIEAGISYMFFFMVVIRVWRKVILETRMRPKEDSPATKEIQLAIRKIQLFFFSNIFWVVFTSIFFSLYFTLDWLQERQW